MAAKTKKFSGLKLPKNSRDIQERIPFRRIFYISIILNVIVILFAFLFKDRLPPEIPLYYGLPKGTGQIADRSNIYLPSITALAFILLNTVIILFINNKFLKQALVVTGLVISIFSLTTTLKIMFLVGNF